MTNEELIKFIECKLSDARALVSWLSKAQRVKESETNRRIAVRARREGKLFKAVLDRLKEP